MKELLKLGFSECTIDEMLNQNPNIKDITYEELYQKIDILKNIGCIMCDCGRAVDLPVLSGSAGADEREGDEDRE